MTETIDGTAYPVCRHCEMAYVPFTAVEDMDEGYCFFCWTDLPVHQCRHNNIRALLQHRLEMNHQ